jgi:hypothetical protein
MELQRELIGAENLVPLSMKQNRVSKTVFFVIYLYSMISFFLSILFERVHYRNYHVKDINSECFS